MKLLVLAVVIASSLCSCSNQQVYNASQTNQQNQCDNLQMVQRQDCLKRLGLPYDKYEEERQKLLRDKE